MATLLLLILIFYTPFAATAVMSGLSLELLKKGFIWIDGEGTPTTMCMVSAKNGTSASKTCTMTEGFGPRSVGCFSVWNSVGLMQQGCYSGQEISLRGQCKKGKCVAGGKKSPVSFCCCHGALCNANYS